MSDRKRILIFSILVMASGMFCTAAVTLAILYKLEIREQRDHLMEIAKGQAHFMQAVARFDAIHGKDDHPDAARAATLSQIATAHEYYSGFGETGELVVAQREGDQIVFLFPHRHGDGSAPEPVPWSSEWAEPMRLALSGQKGTLVGLDYRGERVLAAYHPVEMLDLGVVAKADLTEIRVPFVMAALVAGGVTVLLVLVGVGLTLRVADPLVRQLQQSEERLRLTLDAVSDGGWDWNVVTGEVRYSDCWLESLGYKRDDVPPHASFWRSIVHPDDMPHCKTALVAHLDGRTPSFEYENRLRAASGEYRWNLARGRVVARDGAGKPLRMVGTDTDITERKRAEGDLRKLSAAVEQSPAMIVIMDTNGTIEYVNPRFTEVTGFTKEETLGQNPRMLKSGKWPKKAYQQLWKTILAGKTWRGEFENKKKNGELYWESASISPVRNAQGAITHFLAAKEDITERKQVEGRLRAANAKMEKLARFPGDNPNPVLQVARDGTVLYANSGSHSLMSSWGVRVGQVMPADWPQRIEALLRSGRGSETEVTCQDRVFLFFLAPMVEAEYVYFYGHDITERRHAEEELRQAKEETEAANQELKAMNMQLEHAIERANQMAVQAEFANIAKSQFLANMSHEIRTPMTAILGYADVMSDGLTDPVSIDAVETIKRNGQHLLELINDILDLSKVESGKMTAENQRCDLMQLIGDTAASLRPKAEAKNIRLDVKYAGAIPRTICTDPTRLRQALMNLVGNAIKFTAQGGVTIRVGLLGNKSVPELLIEIVDTGIGVPPDRLRAIFEPFQQADSSTTRKFGGTGLGLTISKRIAELLGGGLEVQSEVGKGSVFALRVATGALDGVEMIDQPVEEAGSRYEAERERATGELDCRILLVEDGPDNQRLIAFVLKKAGAEVEVADNGKIGADLALAAASEDRPFDVILMDMQMPVMDGYEATEFLRQEGYTGPIIALTAHAMDGDRQKCLDAGCDDYATKPIDRAKLISAIKNVSRAMPLPASFMEAR